ncbi:MAG: hypothetical protein K0R11_881 [Acidimicrobiales bacterium]|nr:hypothetical protein [Acidimicrobiales bacterium]
MGLTAVALLTGGLLGLVAGGRVASLGTVTLRWWGALLAGVGLQVLAGPVGVGGRPGTTAVAGSYLCLLAFTLANRALVGMPVVIAGLVLNATVILVNGGMPVRAEAVAAVGIDPDELDAADLGAKRHLEGPDDQLTFLGDVLPLRPLGEVVSVGDLVLAVGVAGLLFRLLRPRTPVAAPT